MTEARKFYNCPKCGLKKEAPPENEREESWYRFDRERDFLWPQMHSWSKRYQDSSRSFSGHKKSLSRSVVFEDKDEPRQVSDIPLPFPVWVEKREPVYRCQSVTCGAYALARHLDGRTKGCPCGASVMQCGDDVAANQYRNIITMNDEYRAENKTLHADVRRLEGRLLEINRLKADLERVRQAKAEFATGYFLQTSRVQQCKDVIDAHVRHGAALEEVFHAQLELLRTCRKAGLDTHVPRLDELGRNDDEPLDVDMVGRFGAGDKVRVLVQRFPSIPVGTLGDVDSVWPALDSQPIVVNIHGRGGGTRYAFNADELERVEEDVF